MPGLEGQGNSLCCFKKNMLQSGRKPRLLWHPAKEVAIIAKVRGV